MLYGWGFTRSTSLAFSARTLVAHVESSFLAVVYVRPDAVDHGQA